MVNRGVIVNNDRERFIFIKTTAIKKDVISYKVDKDFLRDGVLKNDSREIIFYNERK